MKTLLTGIKPTGVPHLGNYLGAMRPSIDLSMDQAYNSFLFIADYHSLTTVHKGSELRQYIYEIAATWIACGLDPEKTTIYKQSEVPETFELAWVLSCFTPKGFMNRAHSYKDKLNKNQDDGEKYLDHGVNMGLFNYPVLMSADILLFSADVVPVGADQLPHLEFTRDIAQKFNNCYGDLLKVPEALVSKETKIIPGLDGQKMSKSYDNTIPLFLDSKKLRKKIMKIKTDSTPPETPKDPNDSLIFDLYKEFAGTEQVSELKSKYEVGIGWGDAKQYLFEAIEENMKDQREIYNDLTSDTDKLDKILKLGGEKARDLASPLMDKVRKITGVR